MAHKVDHTDRNWFIIYSVAFIFGLVWAMVGDSNTKILFVTVTFGLFLYSGIKMELNALKAHKAH